MLITVYTKVFLTEAATASALPCSHDDREPGYDLALAERYAR